MNCGRCGAYNPYDDGTRNCWSCGEKLGKTSPKKDPTPARASVSTERRPPTRHFSNAQPIWKLVTLGILTFSLYEFYWFYRNWSQLRDLGRSRVSPWSRTLALLIPVYGEVLIYRQIRDIKDAAIATGCRSFSSPGAILAAYLAINSLLKLPDPYWLLSSLSIVPLAVVQSTLNRFWAKQQPGLDMRNSLTKGEWAVAIIGGVFMVLNLMGIFLPE